MNEVFGLPAHPLIVHAPVVLLPLALLGVILCLVRPQWRASLIVPTAVIGIIGAGGAILASQSGEWLQARVAETAQVHDHQQLGEMARNLSILFAGSLFVWALREMVETRGWFKDGFVAKLVAPRWIGIAATIGVVLFGTLTTAWVIQAGHSGAKAAWKGKLQAPHAVQGD
jgi:hypothetical protein